MLLGSFEARFAYGLLVVAAPESTDAHDGWDASAETVHAGPDSLYVGVRQTASGLVKVACVEEADVDTELRALFSGQLTLPSARLKFYDPDETISLIVPVSGTSMAVTVYGDDNEEPSELLIQVSEAAS